MHPTACSVLFETELWVGEAGGQQSSCFCPFHPIPLLQGLGLYTGSHYAASGWPGISYSYVDQAALNCLLLYMAHQLTTRQLYLNTSRLTEKFQK